MSESAVKSQQVAMFCIKKYLENNRIVFLCGNPATGKKFTIKNFEKINSENFDFYHINNDHFFSSMVSGARVEVSSYYTFCRACEDILDSVKNWKISLADSNKDKVLFLHNFDDIIYFASTCCKTACNVGKLIESFLVKIEEVSKCVITCHKNTARELLTQNRWFHTLSLSDQDRQLAVENFLKINSISVNESEKKKYYLTLTC